MKIYSNYLWFDTSWWLIYILCKLNTWYMISILYINLVNQSGDGGIIETFLLSPISGNLGGLIRVHLCVVVLELTNQLQFQKILTNKTFYLISKLPFVYSIFNVKNKVFVVNSNGNFLFVNNHVCDIEQFFKWTPMPSTLNSQAISKNCRWSEHAGQEVVKYGSGLVILRRTWETSGESIGSSYSISAKDILECAVKQHINHIFLSPPP